MKIFKDVVLVMAMIISGNIAEAQIHDDWTEIRKVLTDCTGLYPGANNNVATSGLPDGPLLGNGTVGVVGACDNTWGRFYITTTDFWTGAHLNAVPLPIGGVNIIAGGSSVTGLRQEQNMLHAEIMTKLPAGPVEIHTWVSATRNYMVSEVWTTGSNPLDITAETWVHMTNSAKYPVSNGVSGGKTGWVSRETESGKEIDWVCRAALATNVIGAECKMETTGNNSVSATFTLQPGQRVFVVTAVRSGKDIRDHVTGAVALAMEMTKPAIDKLHLAHLDWWKNYWMKSYVRTYDPQLEKYYFGALYESACAYREGSICPGLFGPWVTTDKPNWDGNYTLSYNHQSTVVGFASSNRPELLLPYIQQRYDWAAEGRRRAQRGDINFVTGGRWAPEGYHVATDSDWVLLASWLGGRDTAGLEMKNGKGFGALMGGYRNGDGNFYGSGVNGYWWSTTVIFRDVMWNVVLNHQNSVVFRNYSKLPDGLSVRCIKDQVK